MFFDWMTREGIIDRNPTRRNGDRIIQRPKQIAPEENDNVVTVSGDDVRLLLHESLRGKRWDEALAIHCLVYLGPRRKALALVRLRDYDPDERTITFIEKGSKTITKPVPDTLADLIDAAIAYRDPEGEPLYMDPADYLIPSGAEQRRPGNRDDRIIWKIVRRVAYRAEVKTHVHALRAAFAVAFLEQYPGDLVALQNLMGHARMETTLVYLRRLNRRQRMETVRGLSWDAPGFPQSAVEPLHVPDGTEKEGFEPSLDAESFPGRLGTRSADDAPQNEAV
jgi:integrase